MVYDRNKKMYDEPHVPVQLAKQRIVRRGKFLDSAYAQSYLLQIQTIHGLNVRKVLEVGAGENYNGRNLKELGYTYHTIDITDDYDPTYLSKLEDFDASKVAGQYDLTCAFQVLEHIPYSMFTKCVNKLKQMSKKYVFISIPYSCKGHSHKTAKWSGQGQAIRKNDIQFSPTELPNRKYRPEFATEFPWAVHHWEMGRKGYMPDKIFNDLHKCGLKTIRKFHSPNPFHYFILMHK